MPWLNVNTMEYVERASPSSMKERFPALTFIDGNGKAMSNAEWNFALDGSLVVAVIGQPRKYWILVAGVAALMSQAERDAIDAALLTASRDSIANEIDQLETYTRAFALVVLDEINSLRSQHGLSARTTAQLKTAIRNKLDT